MPSRGTVRILRAAVAAMRPRGHGFDQPIDEDVLGRVQEFFPRLPAPLRLTFPIGLHLLEWSPLLAPGRRTRFSRLPAPDARAVLESFLRAGGLRAAMVVGLRALVFLAFYQHPRVLADMGIDWQGRADALTRRRAALLTEAEQAGSG